MPAPDALSAPPEPAAVNLGPSQDPATACAACANFMPDGMCAALQIPVEPSMVCDLFTQAEAPPQVDMMTKLFGAG